MVCCFELHALGWMPSALFVMGQKKALLLTDGSGFYADSLRKQCISPLHHTVRVQLHVHVVAKHLPSQVNT